MIFASMQGNTLLAVWSCFTLLLFYCCSASALDSFADAEWPNHGGGIANRREGHQSSKIDPETAPNLKLKWRFATNLSNFSDVTTTPSLADSVLYFPTSDGFLYAVHQSNGKLQWQKNLTELTNSSVTYLSRHTPVVSGKHLLVGIYNPAVVLAIDRRNGDLIWSTLLDTAQLALITASGTVYKSSYYVGVSSLQETLLVDCCTFQGSFVKIDIHSGKIVWQTKMLPDNGGKTGLYAGAAVWGSSPPIDPKRKLVYIATGNLYQVPPEVEECELKQRNKTVPDIPDPCVVPEDHSESILALDLDTGSVKWSHHLGGYDVWRYSCLLGPPNCPDASGQDYDFGEAPMMLRIPKSNSTKRDDDAEEEDAHEEWRDIVVAGQKSGFVWALDRDDGQIVWGTAAGPGGLLGGASWGSATDSYRVYTNIMNSYYKNFTLVPSTKVTLGGGWVAMDAPTGTTLWSTATPDATLAFGPISVTNGVVFGTSVGNFHGSLYALEAKSGQILWQHQFRGSITGGTSIGHNCIFIGEGVAYTLLFNNSNKGYGGVSAFCL